MGLYAAGNTTPVTGWRNWKQRLALSGEYAPDQFSVPSITPAKFWRSRGMVDTSGGPLAGVFVDTSSISAPKWGLSGALDELQGWLQENKSLLLMGGAAIVGLMLTQGTPHRRHR